MTTPDTDSPMVTDEMVQTMMEVATQEMADVIMGQGFFPPRITLFCLSDDFDPDLPDDLSSFARTIIGPEEGTTEWGSPRDWIDQAVRFVIENDLYVAVIVLVAPATVVVTPLNDQGEEEESLDPEGTETLVVSAMSVDAQAWVTTWDVVRDAETKTICEIEPVQTMELDESDEFNPLKAFWVLYREGWLKNHPMTLQEFLLGLKEALEALEDDSGKRDFLEALEKVFAGARFQS